MSIPHVPEAAFPRRSGHVVAPWIDGYPFYTRVYEAFQQAKKRVWFAVSFLHRDFAFPQGPSLFDTLDRLVERGVDVRVLFWRNPQFFNTSHLFLGDEADRAFLRERDAKWFARWDSSYPVKGHSHHHKLWLVDSGEADGFAFIGGLTWGNNSLDTPSHNMWRHSRHDLCLEVHGPCVDDIVSTFCEHWEREQTDPTHPAPWPESVDTSMPSKLGPTSRVHKPGVDAQITRSRHREHFPHTGGAREIHEQYVRAFAHAKHTIYIENQHPGEEQLLSALEDALARGVRVVMIVPGDPMKAIRREKERYDFYKSGVERYPSRYTETFAALTRLSHHPLFTMASLAVPRTDPHPHNAEIYVHAKLCIVDDEWVTCGSANLVDLSFHEDHTECNLSVWDKTLARQMLHALIEEHTHQVLQQNAHVSDWLKQLATCAAENRARRTRGECQHGHVYEQDAATYPNN